MKHLLTPEQSATLIAKGISADKASAALIYLNYADEEVESDRVFKREDGVLLTRLRCGMVDGVTTKIVFKEPNSRYSIPIFTLADILSLLPKTINYETLYMECLGTTWEVGYRCERKTFSISEVIYKEELIDALYELVLWCIDNRIKLD